ncbi:MAG: hypothetical protein WBP81_16870 [Solirubrobacteraceae bacterium]
MLDPELRISTPYREWNLDPDITRMPEFCTPALGPVSGTHASTGEAVSSRV